MPSLDGRVRRILQLITAILTPVVGVEAMKQALAGPTGVDLVCELPQAGVSNKSRGIQSLECRPGPQGQYDREFKTWLELEVAPAVAGWQASLPSGEPVAARPTTDGRGRPVLFVVRGGDPARPFDPFTWGAGIPLVLKPVGVFADTPRVTDWRAHLVDAPMDSREAQERRRRDHVLAWVLFAVTLLPAAVTVFVDEAEADAETLTDRLVRRCVDNAVAHFERKDRKTAQDMLRDVMFDNADADQVVPPGKDGKRDSVRQLLFLGASTAFITRLGGVQDEIDRRLAQAAEAAEDVRAAGPPPPPPPPPAPGDVGRAR